MKTFFIFLFIISISVSAQTYNQIVYDDSAKQDILIGLCTSNAFGDTLFSKWFNEEYDNYTPVDYAINNIKEKLNDLTITLIMATWCSDSRREVPRFYKIVDLLGFDENNIKLICVNRLKQCPDVDISEYGIQYVPTFIFYKNGVEIGRIIEEPRSSIEEEIMDMLED